MVMMKKDKIGQNFDKGAAAYDLNAVIQRNCAGTLMRLLRKRVATDGISSIIEIGCGTGFVSERLVRAFSGADFALTDLSDGMLEKCALRLASTKAFREGRIRLLRQDGERLDMRGADLIVSGLTFQWFEDLPSALRRLHSLLNPGGTLAFSILSSETFASLRESFASVNTPFPGPSLPQVDVVKNALSDFSEVHLETETRPETHVSTREFLKSLRSIGAGNPVEQRLPVTSLRRAIQAHERRAPSTADGLTFDYHVAYAICTKK